MTTVEKINVNNLRIALLKSRGETMNARIIRKIERQNRALQSKV